jgi:hypothetical protein
MVLDFWRCRPDLNRCMKVLQTFALPLGYGTFGPPARGFPRANGIVAWGVWSVNQVLTAVKTVL